MVSSLDLLLVDHNFVNSIANSLSSFVINHEFIEYLLDSIQLNGFDALRYAISLKRDSRPDCLLGAPNSNDLFHYFSVFNDNWPCLLHHCEPADNPALVLTWYSYYLISNSNLNDSLYWSETAKWQLCYPVFQFTDCYYTEGIADLDIDHVSSIGSAEPSPLAAIASIFHHECCISAIATFHCQPKPCCYWCSHHISGIFQNGHYWSLPMDSCGLMIPNALYPWLHDVFANELLLQELINHRLTALSRWGSHRLRLIMQIWLCSILESSVFAIFKVAFALLLIFELFTSLPVFASRLLILWLHLFAFFSASKYTSFVPNPGVQSASLFKDIDRSVDHLCNAYLWALRPLDIHHWAYEYQWSLPFHDSFLLLHIVGTSSIHLLPHVQRLMNLPSSRPEWALQNNRGYRSALSSMKAIVLRSWCFGFGLLGFPYVDSLHPPGFQFDSFHNRHQQLALHSLLHQVVHVHRN